MKFLIWMLCLFVFTMLNELLGMAIGFKLGYLILYLLCSVTAKALCRKWDERKSEEEDEKEQEMPEVVVSVIPDVPQADPVPQPQQKILAEDVFVTEAEKKELKNRALQYLPRSLDQIGTQRKIIQMLAEGIPSVCPCVDDAERELWPKVAQNLLPISRAAAQCGNEADKMIGITIFENLKLESQSEETLLKAWIALDYYSYLLKPEYSINIRKLQDYITAVLRNR